MGWFRLLAGGTGPVQPLQNRPSGGEHEMTVRHWGWAAAAGMVLSCGPTKPGPTEPEPDPSPQPVPDPTPVPPEPAPVPTPYPWPADPITPLSKQYKLGSDWQSFSVDAAHNIWLLQGARISVLRAADGLVSSVSGLG